MVLLNSEVMCTRVYFSLRFNLGRNKNATTKYQKYPAKSSTSSNPSVIDFVGYGSANGSETTPAPAPSNNTSISRVGSGCTDSNVNDFTISAPNPRNTATTPNVCP
jgi:hypothetical protein